MLLAATAYAHSAAGRVDAATKALAELNGMTQSQYVPPLTMAIAYSAKGDVEAAYRKLVKLRRNGPRGFRRCGCAGFEAVRRDPRFPELLARMNLS